MNSEYCKICEVEVPIGGMKIHVDGKTHKKKLVEYYKCLSYTDDGETKVNCEICYVNIPKVDRNIIEHMEGRNHEIAVTELLKFHLITKESSWYLCECCEVQTTDYLEHINSRSHTITFLEKYEIDKTEMRKYVYESDINDLVARHHRVLYRNLLKHTGIYKLNDTSYYCGMCQIKLGRICELDHVLGERHALKLDEINEYFKFLTNPDAKTNVNCEICYVNIPKVDRNIIEHMEGRNHEIAVTELLEFHLMTKESSWYLCECCEVQTTDYLEHINSRSHTITFLQKYEIDKTEMRKYVYESDVNNMFARCHRVQYRNLLKHTGIYKINETSYYCGMCQIKLGRISELDHVLGERHALKLEIDEYYKLLTNPDDAKTKVYCEICYVNIPKVDKNIIEHMEGRNHDIAVTELLEIHLITKESSWYLCECCEVHTKDYLEHINSKSHTITLLQKHEIDKTEMREYVYESDINDVVACHHRVLYRNLLKHTGIYKLNETSYYCGMCQIKLGRISELDHVLGGRHALKLAEIEDL